MYDYDAYPSPAGYFVAADGVQLPWFQYGDTGAAQTILLLNGFTCNQFNIAKVVAGLAADYRIVTFDYRGQGLAWQIAHDDVSVDAVMADIDAFHRHLGSPRVILMGYSMGCQLAVEWNYRDNSNVQALVLLLGIYGSIFDTFLGLGIFAPLLRITYDLFPRFKEFYKAAWKFAHSLPYSLRVALGKGTLLNPEKVSEEELRPFLDQLAELDFEYLLQMSHAIHHHTNEGQYHRITAPCLIVSGEKDLFALPLHSERVHQAVAGSWYVSVPGGTHNAVLENSEEIVEIVREFLAEKKAQSAS